MKLIEVTFKSDKLLVVQNGSDWVAVSPICKNLGIDDKTQIRKIKSDEAFESKYLEVQTKGGLQKVFCIPLEKLNGWLFTINPNKVKPEVKQKLIAYKNECFKILYNHFIQKAQPPQNCPAADNMSTRIAGYKGQLALKKKEIERLRFELIQANEKLKEYEVVQPLRAAVLKEYKKQIETQKHQAIMLEHNLMDLAGSYARLKEELKGRAETLRFIADEMEKRIESVDYFLESIYKLLPKAKDVADNASARHAKEMQWQNVELRHRKYT